MYVHDIYYDNSCNFNSYSCNNIFQQKLSKKEFIQTNSFFTKTDDDIDGNFFARICEKKIDPTKNIDFITDIIMKDTLANTPIKLVDTFFGRMLYMYWLIIHD